MELFTILGLFTMGIFTKLELYTKSESLNLNKLPSLIVCFPINISILIKQFKYITKINEYKEKTI